MNCSGITERLLDVCDLLVGHVRGGIVMLIFCFSTIMGGLFWLLRGNCSTRL